MKHILASTAFASILMCTAAFADGWVLNPDESQLSFASVKNDYFGEVHSFQTIGGGVSDDGLAEITIDLASVETMIDIRNERMIEHVFGSIATARLTAEFDMAAMEAIAIGDSAMMEVDAVLSFLGAELDVFTDMYIVRITDTRVMALSNNMVFLETDTAGIDACINVLQELAGLDHISRAVPVTLRFVFDAES